MAGSMSGHLVLINHLLAEKDRLIMEKDELVLSKEKLWREMHAVSREREAEIERLKAAGAIDERADFSGKNNLLATVMEENAGLKKRNEELEDVLEKLLADRDVDAEQGEDEPEHIKEEEDEDDLGVDGTASLKPEYEMRDSNQSGAGVDIGARHFIRHGLVPKETSSLDQDEMARITGFEPSQPASAVCDDRAISTVCSKFTFAPLVALSSDGTHQTAKIEEVAAVVQQAVRRQLETLTLRSRAGKCPASASPQFYSTGCMWNWMHGSANETRWTLEGRRNYACAGCFNVGRPCLFWSGNMKWMILPLLPAVRRSDANWRDMDYYINQDVGTIRSMDGVWQPGKNKRKR